LPVGITIAGPIGADRATLLAADWIHARLRGPTTDLD
jgi:Asp-tRNA(Asn)/Glu-tRNA(Gln) amidotransferase A subunit family amidase